MQKGDFVAADQVFTDGMQGPFVTSDEQPLADAMLDAWDGGTFVVTHPLLSSLNPNPAALLTPLLLLRHLSLKRVRPPRNHSRYSSSDES